MSELSDHIKLSLTAAQVAEMYGFKPDRGGFIKCPFHSGDKNGSLKLYPEDRGWHCFGCQAGGDIISFVMKLFGLSFKDACNKLNTDFGLGFSGAKFDKKAFSEVQRKREAERKEKEEKDRRWWSACKFYHKCPRILEERRPKLVNGEPPEQLDPLYVKALKMETLEMWLEENL